MSIDHETVKGLKALGRGTRFDLLASLTFSPQDALVSLGSRVEVSSGPVLQTDINSRARNMVLAEGALVVSVDEENATIAVHPNEVAEITKAITLELPMYTLVRPGTSEGESEVAPSVLKSEPSPIGRLTVVEDIVGGQRTVRVFASPKKQEAED